MLDVAVATVGLTGAVSAGIVGGMGLIGRAGTILGVTFIVVFALAYRFG